jgi:hypothetical protein
MGIFGKIFHECSFKLTSSADALFLGVGSEKELDKEQAMNLDKEQAMNPCAFGCVQSLIIYTPPMSTNQREVFVDWTRQPICQHNSKEMRITFGRLSWHI